MKSPAAVPRTPPAAPGVRLLRALALLGLALILTLLLGLALVAAAPDLFAAALESLFRWSADSSSHLAGWLTVAFVTLTPVALLVLAWRLRLRSWWWIGGGYLAVAPVLAYLAADEPVRHALTLEEIAPAFPGAETSYAVLMRYSKPDTSGAFAAFVQLRLSTGLVYPNESDKWLAYLSAHRADLTRAWDQLAPVRGWLAELNAFDRIGDLGTATPRAPGVGYAVWRTLAHHTAACAGLQALDGQGDAAFATLLPLLEVSRKLEPSSRLLGRFMLAREIQKITVDAAGFVLDHTAVSAASRARWVAALQAGGGGEAGARRLLAIDYALVFEAYAERFDFNEFGGDHGRLWPAFNLLRPLLYNPHRTVNLLGDLYADMEELAARRESGKIGPCEEAFLAQAGRPRFKNLLGAVNFSIDLPAFTRVVEHYWKAEDARTALLARLATDAPPVVAAPVAGGIDVGLAGHWPLDGDAANQAADTLPGVNHGALPTADRFGHPGGAFLFDGVSSHLDLPDPTGRLSFDARTQNYSVACWVRLDAKPDGDCELIMDRGTGANVPTSITVSYRNWNGGRYDVFMAEVWDGVRGCRVMGTTHPEVGRWYHLAFVMQNRQMKLFVDGAPDGRMGLWDDNPTRLSDDFGPTRNHEETRVIGRFSGEGGFKNYFRGALDDVRIYDRALSAAEIGVLFQTN